MLHRLLPEALAGAGTRALLAGATALGVSLAVGRPVIAALRRLKAGERTEKTPIEDEALRRRIAAKSGTPTMGGLILLAGLAAGSLAWGKLGGVALPAALATAAVMALLGMTDDLRKLRGAGHRDRGLKARYKLIAQGIVGAALALALLRRGPAGYGPPLLSGMSAAATVLFVGWAAFVVAAMSNATNVTDGLDGLLAGLTPLAATVLAGGCWVAGNAQAAAGLGFEHVPGAGELAVFCGAMAGAALGFLCFNRHPARVFMGDTGALAVGGGLAAAALAARHELLLAVVGLVFLAEFGSSLLQIGYFKATGGRRILPVAPLHHTFEMQGRPEPLIVRGFYLCGALAALLGVTLIYL